MNSTLVGSAWSCFDLYAERGQIRSSTESNFLLGLDNPADAGRDDKDLKDLRVLSQATPSSCAERSSESWWQ